MCTESGKVQFGLNRELVLIRFLPLVIAALPHLTVCVSSCALRSTTALPDVGARHVRLLPSAHQVRRLASLELAQEPDCRAGVSVLVRRRSVQPVVKVERTSTSHYNCLLLLLSQQ